MSLFKASAFFAAGTMVSRVFGIVRESVVAGVFGDSLALNAFLVANRIPNMLREMLAEGALGSSFTKVFSEMAEKDRTRSLHLLRDAFFVCTLLAVVVCGLGIVLSPYLVSAMTMMSADTATAHTFYEQAVFLTQLLFPFIGLMILGAIAAGALHQHGRFFTSAASPIALNLGYLAGALLFAELMVRLNPEAPDPVFQRVIGLALGVLLGGLLQLLIQLYGIWQPYLQAWRSLPRWRLSSSFANPDVRKVFGLMGPMAIASSAGQINVLVNTNFATSLGDGAVAWLTFSFRILQLPIGLFAVAISVVALPKLTRAVAAARQANGTDQAVAQAQVGSELSQALEWMLWLIAPCCCYVLVSSLPICRLLLQHWNYSPAATLATASALYYYGFGLVAYGLIKVLTSYYYAAERTRYAMQVSLVGIVVNYAANALLVHKFGHNGLAMTSSVVLTLNALLLFAGLRRERLRLPGRVLVRSLTCLVGAFLLALALQGLASIALNEALAAWPVKLQTACMVVLNGCIVCVLFIGFGLIRLQTTPAKAWQMFQSQRRRTAAKGS